MKYLLTILLIFSQAKADREVYHFYENLDWSYFFDKLEVDFDLCNCPIEDSGNYAVGFKTKIVEPIGYATVSNIPWNFSGLGIKMDKSFLRKQGTSRKDPDSSTFRHTHFIIFPPLGWSIGLMQDYFCFERGSIFNMAYLSEVIPSHNNDVIALMEEANKPVSRVWFSNPIAEMACSADCAGATFNKPVNSLYWCDGCRGSVGATDVGWTRLGRPFEDAETIVFRLLNRMHLYGGMLKTKEGYFAYNPTGINLASSMCRARYFPIMIKDQYRLQFARRGKKWDAEPFGKIRFHYDFKSEPTDEDTVFFWIWRERDMCAGAAKCRSTFTGM